MIRFRLEDDVDDDDFEDEDDLEKDDDEDEDDEDDSDDEDDDVETWQVRKSGDSAKAWPDLTSSLDLLDWRGFSQLS